MKIDLNDYSQMSPDLRRILNNWMWENDLPPLVFEIEYGSENIVCSAYKQTPRGITVIRKGKMVIEKITLPTVSPIPIELRDFIIQRREI